MVGPTLLPRVLLFKLFKLFIRIHFLIAIAEVFPALVSLLAVHCLIVLKFLRYTRCIDVVTHLQELIKRNQSVLVLVHLLDHLNLHNK